MSYTKILPSDLVNKGVIGLPDTPGLDTTQMQQKFDEIALDVIVPKFNNLVDELDEAASGTETEMAGKADKVSSATSGNFAGLDSNGNLTDSGSCADDFLTSTDIEGKADKVESATSGNFAGLDENGNLTDSGSKASDFLTEHQDISGKADKVSSATNGNFAGLDSNGNLTDSGSKASDFLTEHQDISGKADKVSSATEGNFAGLDSNGNLTDSGHKHSDYLTSVPMASASVLGGIKVGDNLSIDSNGVLSASASPTGKMDIDGSNAASAVTFGGSFTVGSRRSATVGTKSTAEGNLNVASGDYSHAEGMNATASGDYSHAEGSSTASGESSHAEGSSTASGELSHSEAYGTASGYKSHAEGDSTASGKYTHTEGFNTSAAQDYQHVQGKYNHNKSTTLFEIGNGTGSSAKSNAFEVYSDGAISQDDGTTKFRFTKSNSKDGYYDKDGTFHELGGDVANKADKVTNATSGNFAGLDSNGNLTDSGHKHSDYLTSLPIASANTLGGIKVGANLTIDANGVLSGQASGGGGDMLASTYDPNTVVGNTSGGIPAYVEANAMGVNGHNADSSVWMKNCTKLEVGSSGKKGGLFVGDHSSTVTSNNNAGIGNCLQVTGYNQLVIGMCNNNKSTTYFEVGNGSGMGAGYAKNVFEIYKTDGAISQDDGASKFRFTQSSGVDGYYDANNTFHAFTSGDMESSDYDPNGTVATAGGIVAYIDATITSALTASY